MQTYITAYEWQQVHYSINQRPRPDGTLPLQTSEPHGVHQPKDSLIYAHQCFWSYCQYRMAALPPPYVQNIFDSLPDLRYNVKVNILLFPVILMRCFGRLLHVGCRIFSCPVTNPVHNLHLPSSSFSSSSVPPQVMMGATLTSPR